MKSRHMRTFHDQEIGYQEPAYGGIINRRAHLNFPISNINNFWVDLVAKHRRKKAFIHYK